MQGTANEVTATTNAGVCTISLPTAMQLSAGTTMQFATAGSNVILADNSITLNQLSGVNVVNSVKLETNQMIIGLEQANTTCVISENSLIMTNSGTVAVTISNMHD